MHWRTGALALRRVGAPGHWCYGKSMHRQIRTLADWCIGKLPVRQIRATIVWRCGRLAIRQNGIPAYWLTDRLAHRWISTSVELPIIPFVYQCTLIISSKYCLEFLCKAHGKWHCKDIVQNCMDKAYSLSMLFIQITACMQNNF